MVAWVAGCLLVVAAAFTAGRMVQSPWASATDNATAAVTTTTEVAEHTFLQEQVQISGTVQLGSDLVVPVIESEFSRNVVTDVPLAPGDAVTSGTVLGTISGRPLIALDLDIPMYRDVTVGDSGPDVASIQRSLKALGMYSGREDGVFGSGTSTAIRKLYRENGLTVSETPAVDTAAAQVPDTASTAEPESTPAPAPSATVAPNVVLPMAEIVDLPAGTTTIASIAHLGDVLATDAAFATLRTGGSHIVARAGVAEVDRLAVGTTVQSSIVGTPTPIAGVVVGVSEFKAADDQGNPPGYDITVELDDALPDGITQGTASAVVAGGSPDGQVALALPVSAIRTNNSGTYVVLADGVTRVDVALGAEDGGFVAIGVNAALPAGTDVLIGPLSD
ncbi:MAG: hypothetical protein HGA51_09005 [Demequinaceae bacterium]|nr:hypothetical protein [Demequinaceae bacterium]